MKTNFILSLIFTLLMCCSCGGDEPNPETGGNPYSFPFFPSGRYAINDVQGPHVKLDGLNIKNLPIWDCSTSTRPVEALLVCGLLGLDYCDYYDIANESMYTMMPDYSKLSTNDANKLHDKLLSNTTHGAFINLIDGKVDIAVCSRALSRAEIEYANEKGVEILQTPIALDGFVFIVNENNPVEMLTVDQIRQIYTADITNWKDVGGNDATISPYIRDANSGSQEKMETLVMNGLTMIDWPHMRGFSMLDPFFQVSSDDNGIGYTLYYFANVMALGTRVKMLGLNGVAATKENIINGSYPFITEVVIAVRNDIKRNSWAWKCYNLVATGQENGMIDATGYVAGKINI